MCRNSSPLTASTKPVDLSTLTDTQLLQGFLQVISRPGELTAAQVEEIRPIHLELAARDK